MKNIYFFIILAATTLHTTPIHLTREQKKQLGTAIWHNECAGSIEKLTFWNPKEAFPSFGIGHCIWFPEKINAPYTQTFPQLIQFLRRRKVAIPNWLVATKHCPWRSQNEFITNFNTPPMQELRTLLSTTIEDQTDFIITQLENALPKILRATPRRQRRHIKNQFNRLAATPRGLYALIDYCNFKGDGTNQREQRNGQGWGLRHVLTKMNANATNPIEEFTQCAKELLTLRVKNAPEQAGEHQFLNGWHNRLKTYLSDLF